MRMLTWIKDHQKTVDAFSGLLLVFAGLGQFFGYPHHFRPFQSGDLVVATIVVLVATGVAILSWVRKAPSARIGLFVNLAIAGTLILLSMLHYNS
jgi:uncharacterized protein (DUF486 family)